MAEGNYTLSFTYENYKRLQDIERGNLEFKHLDDVLKRFRNLRADIFQLYYDAKNINTSYINDRFLSCFVDELELIMPVIEKLTETAQFISREELTEWQREHMN